MNRVIFWDFDGTLVYSKSLWSNAVFKVLEHNIKNNTITFDEIRPYIQNCFPWDNPKQDFSQMTGDLWWEYMFNKFSDVYSQFGFEKSIAHVMSRKVKEIILKVDKYHLYDDTISTLEKCINLGYENYLVSNNYPELEEVIHQLNISKYFKDYIVSGKIGYDKPRKEIYEYALEKANYPKICYMIGDNPIADIEGANAVGIPSILVHRDINSNAVYTFGTLAEIFDAGL